MVLTHNRVDSSGGTPNEASEPIPFAGSMLGAQRHVCAFFHNPDEEYRVLLPFIKDGFEGGEKAGTPWPICNALHVKPPAVVAASVAERCLKCHRGRLSLDRD